MDFGALFEARHIDANRRSQADGPRKFLTFRLGAERYGIDILKVQEIRSYEAPTAVAHTPPFIKGVINLRGVVVPILDLRIKFQLGHANYDGFTVVIILNVARRVVGVVVDSVSDVITLTQDSIGPATEPARTTFASRYITGLRAVHDRILIRLT